MSAAKLHAHGPCACNEVRSAPGGVPDHARLHLNLRRNGIADRGAAAIAVPLQARARSHDRSMHERTHTHLRSHTHMHAQICAHIQRLRLAPDQVGRIWLERSDSLSVSMLVCSA